MDYKNRELSVEARVKDLMSVMTLDEKIAQVQAYWVYQINDGKHLSRDIAGKCFKEGIGQITRVSGGSSMKPDEAAQFANEVQKYLLEETRLGIPAMIHEEACSGFTAIGATTFPQSIGLASSFEPELTGKIGEVIRRQMRAVGAHQALAPLMDVTRDPRWGRTEETYGEDPYLVSQMGMEYIKGIQGNLDETGIMATGKHFVGYGISEGGMNWAPAHIGQRELREVYLAPFEAAVKEAKLASIMNGYHELDGVPCGASKELLTDILKEQWGFEGIVVSDYFAINQLYDYHHMAADKVEAAKMALEAGMDVELPNVDCFGAPLKEGIESGVIDIKYLDTCVAKILKFKFQLGLFEQPFVDTNAVNAQFDTQQDRDLAYEAAVKSMVLLKNKDGILPLSKDLESIAVIGPCADNIRHMIGDYTYQGQIEGLLELNESQSSELNQPIPQNISIEENIVAMESILRGIEKAVSEDTKVYYAKGCDCKKEDRSQIPEAVAVAQKAKAAIVCVGDLSGITLECTAGESVDRAELTLPGVQGELIKEICATGVPTIVLLTNGRPYALNWENEHADAILEAWFPGEEGSKAAADVLFGDAVPGGKLPITFPRTSGQIPTFYMHKKSGGRSHWRGDYDDFPAAPLYPFGYGLSYTTFEYSDFAIGRTQVEIGESVDVSVTIKNTGACDGDEIVQLYIHDEAASVTRPVKEMKGFKRIHLAKGESKKVTFTLPTVILGFYGIDLTYIVEPGEIEIMIGASSDDIKGIGTIEVLGKRKEMEKEKVFTVPVSVHSL